MSRIVVTGGAGFIGSYLCKELVNQGHTVVCIDLSDGDRLKEIRSHPKLTFIRDSILNHTMMEREIKQSDLIFHLAAIADPMVYVTEPLTTLQLDLKASIDIFEMAASNGIKVAFASTSEVYGRNPNVPWKEDDERVLGSTRINRWSYSTAKSACEHYCYAYAQQRGLKFVIYRFFNIYGPMLDTLGNGRAIPIMLQQFLSNEPVTIHGDGKQTRSFTYIDDAVTAVADLAFSEKAEGEAFNVGCEVETTIAELATMMKVVANSSSELVFVPHEKVFGKSYEDIPRRVPDVTKIRDVIGWEATISLKEGLARTINYYQAESKKGFSN
jgi:UDP-glucose 4-epimerase